MLYFSGFYEGSFLVTYAAASDPTATAGDRHCRFAGFRLRINTQPKGGRFKDSKGNRHVLTNVRLLTVGVPFWSLFLLLSAYPVYTVVRGPLRRYRRHRAGLCLKCGYNLTGNVGGVCPECGMPIDDSKVTEL